MPLANAVTGDYHPLRDEYEYQHGGWPGIAIGLAQSNVRCPA
jgi:hypothetical protein